MRQYETLRPDNMRRQSVKDLALAQGLAHQPEMKILQITQAAMHKLGGRRGRAGAQIFGLQQNNLKAAPGGIPGNAGPCYAAADNANIIFRASHTARIRDSCLNINKALDQAQAAFFFMIMRSLASTCAGEKGLRI